LRTDDGFEDREGHQAPFTLRKEENVERLPSEMEGVRAVGAQEDRLLELFDRLDDGVEIRPVAGLELGMKEMSIGANFKGAAVGRDER
jgi:hypothetical protein